MYIHFYFNMKTCWYCTKLCFRETQNIYLNILGLYQVSLLKSFQNYKTFCKMYGNSVFKIMKNQKCLCYMCTRLLLNYNSLNCLPCVLGSDIIPKWCTIMFNSITLLLLVVVVVVVVVVEVIWSFETKVWLLTN